jgi:hypothetical protein
MGWDKEKGYIPDDTEAILDEYFESFKASRPEFSNISRAQFEGFEEYRMFFNSSNIDISLQQDFSNTFNNIISYINDTSISIQSPSTVYTTVTDNIEAEFGFEASAKPIAAAEAGNAFIAIDYEPEATLNQSIAQFLMNKCIVAGVITNGDIAAR